MSLARASLIVGVAAAASRVLGFLRDVLIAGALGAGAAADAFLIAFRLPNLARGVLGEGGLNAGFVPLYAGIRAERGADAAAAFAGASLAAAALALAALVAVVEIAAGAVVLALATGFAGDPARLDLATLCTRLAFPFVAGVTLASLIAALLNAERRFMATAFAPLAVNGVMVGAVLALWARPDLGPQGQALWLSGAFGASGFVHLAIVAGAARGARLRLFLARPGMAKNLGLLLRAGLPALAATGAAQLILLSATNAASFTPGAVSWLYYAERVFQLPLGFVGSAVGLVLLPEIALRQVTGDRGGVLDLQNRALEAALLLALPAATALATLAEPMARVLFERGAFGPSDTAGTAMVLAGFAPGLVFAAAGKVLAQPFFIRGRLRTPLLATALGVLVTGACAGAAAERFGALGLGLAASLGLAAHAAMLAWRSHAADLWRPDARLLARAWRIGAASAVMGATTFGAGRALAGGSGPAGLPDAVLLAGLCVGGLALYLAAALALGALTAADLATLRRGRAPLASAGRASP